MSYGEELRQLNPCDPAWNAGRLAALCPMGGALLDVGCGRGATLAELARQENWNLFGLDPDPAMAARAAENCPAACIRTGGAEAIPFADASFDAVLMECVFSLLDDPAETARELRRVLRPGGVLLLTDLWARGEESGLCHGVLIRRVDTRADLERPFRAAGLTLLDFEDRSEDMKAMLIRMILDGTACTYMEEETRAVLRRCRAGYGIWVWCRE